MSVCVKLSDLDVGRATIEPDMIYIPLLNKTGEVLIDINTETAVLFLNGWETPMDITETRKVHMSNRDLKELYLYLEVV